jgi:hypothetical protein
VVALSALERTLRIDAEYFQRKFLADQAEIAAIPSSPIPDLAGVSDGNHFTISDAYVEGEGGIPYFRGQDVSGTFFADPARGIRITREAYDRRYMRRSHLRRGDVLLSIVGTIGASALVDFDDPATCSCKLAILRPSEITAEYLAVFLGSRYGQNRIEQLTRGAVQRGLILEDADQILVPRFEGIEAEIVRLVGSARVARREAQASLAQAEVTLLDALGLRDWSPPRPLTYTSSAATVTAAGRWDSQFHAPAVVSLRERLSRERDLLTLAEAGQVTNGRTVPYYEDGPIPIMRSGDVGKNRACGELLATRPSENIYLVEKGDVLISSIGFGSIGRVEAVTTDEVMGTVSEVTVVRQQVFDAHFLTAYLRSLAGQMQLERFITGATGQLHLYPSDVGQVFVPVLDDQVQVSQRRSAERASVKRAEANRLLSIARRSVEIAIEESETAALAFIADDDSR